MCKPITSAESLVIRDLFIEFKRIADYENIKPVSYSHGVNRWPRETGNENYDWCYSELENLIQNNFYDTLSYSDVTNRKLFEEHSGIIFISDTTTQANGVIIDQGIRVNVRDAFMYFKYPKPKKHLNE